MSYQIKHRWYDTVLYASDVVDSARDALLQAIKNDVNISGASLGGADLRDSDLRDAKLVYANLSGAKLSGTDLSGADLRNAKLCGTNLGGTNLRDAILSGADLSGADLSGTNLGGVNISGADLRDADLRDADLSGTNLGGVNISGASLGGADLSGTNLRDANLIPIRDDFWAVLSSAPTEVYGLRTAIAEGRIDGSVYRGDCACLVGTLANIRQCDYTAIPGLTPNSSRPIERFFLAINPDDTPATSIFSTLALEWVDQWLANMRSAFGVKS